MVRTRSIAVAVLIVGALLLSACSGQPAAPSGEQTPSEVSAGEQLARTKCTMCHTYDRVEQANKSAAEWESTIDRMVGHGLVVSEEERATITDYLVGQGQ
jgi:cytochrome c2